MMASFVLTTYASRKATIFSMKGFERCQKQVSQCLSHGSCCRPPISWKHRAATRTEPRTEISGISKWGLCTELIYSDSARQFKTVNGGAKVTINVEHGMSGPKDVVPGGDYDGILCVYDTRDQNCYTFLEEKVMSAAKSKLPNAFLMVATVGFEYRGSTERSLISKEELQSLAL